MAAFVISMLLFTSCVSTHTALQNIEHGSSKQDVRNTIGKPFSVDRSDGFDRWTYKFSWHSQKYTRDIFFDEGKVQKVGPITPYPNYEKKMTAAEDMEEYEINATLYQRQKEAGFREINSLKTKDSDDVIQLCTEVFWGDTAEQQCKDIMRGHRFITTALNFCTDTDNKIHMDFHKQDCLEIVSNKVFKEHDLLMCSGHLWAISKLRCLSNMTTTDDLSIADENDDIIIFNCSDKHPVQFNLQFSEDKKEHKLLQPMRSTRIKCLQGSCPSPATQPIQVSLPENSQKPLQHSLWPGQIYTLKWDPHHQLWGFSMETGSIICK